MTKYFQASKENKSLNSYYISVPINSKKVIQKLKSKKKVVRGVLERYPSLRKKNKRSMVCKYAKLERPDITLTDVDRLCRFIQNTDGEFRPSSSDGRYEQARIHKSFYGK